jgi:hypothetical protein
VIDEKIQLLYDEDAGFKFQFPRDDVKKHIQTINEFLESLKMPLTDVILQEGTLLTKHSYARSGELAPLPVGETGP